MAKRIYSVTPGVGLDIEPTVEFDQYYEVDKDGFTETKAMKAETLLRTRPTASFDKSGLGTTAISYATYNNAIVTITTDNVITIGTLEDNEACYLTVKKAVANLVTFAGATLLGTIDAYQTNRTELRFRLDSVDGGIIITQLNSQFGDTLISTNLTPTGVGTITTFNYFTSTINNNLCSFEGSFIFTTSGVQNSLNIDISNWDVTKSNAGYTPMVAKAVASGVSEVIRYAEIKEDSMIITLDAGVTNDAITITLNGSFII